MRHVTGVFVNRLIFLVVILLVLQKLHCMDTQVTGKELWFYVTPEYNRTFLFCWDISAIGVLELNNRYTVESGLALGAAGNVFDIKGFVGGEAAPFANIPISFSLDYIYNGLPEYEYHAHSILLLASLKTRRAGFSLGHTFRFNSFFGEPPIFEPIWACLVYIFFINNERLQLGLKSANFNDFTTRNLGAFVLNLNSVIHLNRKISIVNEIEIHQSGSASLAANLYGIVYRGGAVFSW